MALGAMLQSQRRWTDGEQRSGHVRRLQDQIREEQDPTEKADLQELLDKDELAVAAAYAAYEAAREQLLP